MSILNLTNCNTTGNNGRVSCNATPGKPTFAIAAPKGFVIPDSVLTDNDTFLLYLEERFNASDTRNDRFWLSPQLTNFENKTGDPAMAERDGMSYLAQEKPFNWRWTLNTPGQNICDYKQWRNLVHLSSLYDWYVIDDKGQFWYTNGTDTDSLPGAAGFTSSQVLVEQWIPKPADGLTEYKFSIQFLYNDELIENIGFIQCGAFPTDKWGLVDVALTARGTTWTTTTAYVKGTLGCGGSSLGAYSDVLDVAGAWVLYNVTDSSAVTPTAVSYNSTTDEFKFTFTAQTSADVIRVSLAAPSVLNATPYFLNLITEAPITNAIP